jgi:transposase
MATKEAILALHRQGHSNRKISRLLGVNRETVGKHVRAGVSKPAKAPTGSDSESSAAPILRSVSDSEPYRQQILAKLEQGLSAQRIYQDLVEEIEDFSVSYWSVRRFVAKLGQKSTLPFRRLECDPGEEAQIDFGTAAPIHMPDGRQRRPWVLRVVLSYSRKAYSEVVYRQTTESFIGCLENAFAHFGGIPKRLVIDNLKAAVTRADWYDPEIHPKLRSFAKHYGTAILPTRPYTPRHKGKVENGIKYVKENALKGRKFDSLQVQNQFLQKWEAKVADTRIHGTTKKQVERLFQDQERHALLALPRERFAFFHEAQRTVHRDGHLEVDKAFYSTPPEYVGSRLWVRWDARLVRIFNDRFELLATHAKAEPGRFRTAAGHIPREKISAVERGTDQLLRQVSTIGPQSRQWSEAMTQARGVEAVRVLLGLKNLAGQYSPHEMEDACRTALAYGAYHLQTVRKLLKRRGPQQQQFAFTQEHPIIRPLSDYSLESLHEFRKERSP